MNRRVELTHLKVAPARTGIGFRQPRTALLAVCVCIGALATAVDRAWAHPIVVTSTADDGSPGTLRWAINEANNEGAGVHEIGFDLPANSTIVASAPLPLLNNSVATSININGAGAPGLTISGNNATRVFFVEAGTVSISNVTIQDGMAPGGTGGVGLGGGGGGLGAGGGVFVNNGANVTLQSVRFVDNQAAGGVGGNVNLGVSAGGGGAGMQGGGGGGAGWGGGGGGGFNGAGGTSTYVSGGGGGGQYGNGGAVGHPGQGGGGGGGTRGNGGNSGSQNGGGGGGELPINTGGTASGSGGAGSGGGGNGGTEGVVGPTDGAANGGGGGGANGQTGATGGDYGGGGGGGGSRGGGAGGVFGGGGGGGGFDSSGNGGAGGDFGGGGGSGYTGTGGGIGGYGGGGGGGGSGGAAGFGGGAGGDSTHGGNGGSAYGGAVFVREGGALTLIDTDISGGGLAAGGGGTGTFNGANGSAAGTGIYLHNVVATVEVDSGSHDWVDTIAGSGGIEKTGPGELVLSGVNSYTGTTTVSGGRLAVDGSIASQVTVNPSGILGGSGIINQDVFNQGIIAPGNSIGALQINGNLNLGSSTTVEVEIDDQGHGDQINVGGATTIQGGVVNVIAQPGSYTAGRRYTFLTAGSVNGQFDSAIDDLAFFNVLLGYDQTSAYFDLVSSGVDYAEIAQTGNEFVFGTYLDQIEGDPNAQLQEVLTQVNTLSADQARNAYNQMDGDLHGTLGQVGVQNTTLILYQLNNRLAAPLLVAGGYAQSSDFNGASSPVLLVKNDNTPGGLQLVSRRCPPQEYWSGWSFGFGIGGNVQSNGNVSGINYGMGGMLAGLERYLSDETLLGFYGGYVGTGVTARDLNQSGSVNGGQFGSYLRRFDGFNHWTMIGGLEFDGYQTRRNIAFGDINTSASANYSGWQGYAYGERGVTFGGPRLMLQPYGALQYVYLRQNSFDEQGAGVLSLDGRGSDANSLRTFVGGRALFAPYRRLSPQLRAAWVHELLSTNSIVNARFGPIGGAAFAVEGLSLGRDWALVGGGLNWQLSSRWSLYGNYDAMVNARQVLHIGSGGAQYVW